MICFCWAGFPQYAARLVGALVASLDEEVVVVANRPATPVKGMENYVGCRLVWVTKDEHRTLREIVGTTPRCLFVNGWFTPLFNAYRDEVRKSGGRTIVMIDNSFGHSLRDLAWVIRFRILFAHRYDGFMVPGRNGLRMLRLAGIPAARCETGMYAADGRLFQNTRSIVDRPRRMLFVGQMIPRKNVQMLCEAFLMAKGPEKGWTLELCGHGPLLNALPQHANIDVHDFVQPEQLPVVYANARVFVLASNVEHWGLVVHEAALSGCALLLSNRIGAADDLLDEGVNGCSFAPDKCKSLVSAMCQIMEANDSWYAGAERRSRELAETRAGTARFIETVKRLGKC